VKEGKIVKGVAAVPFAATLAIALVGCGAGHHTPRPAATVAASPRAVSAASPAVSAVSATTNERLFADGLSQSIPVMPARVVGGAVMRPYARFEHAYGAAWGAVGQPDSGGSVTRIAGGFKLCWPDTGNGAGCDAFTQLTTNHAGQVTGVSVNGQPVAGRIATAPAATSDGLRISGVVAYRLTGAQDEVAVAFKLADDGYRPVNTSPALLASLGGASDDSAQDALPSTLAPGDTLYAVAGFDITQVTGLFCLQPNDGFGEHLPCTTLRKV
jgi:hypothetical protein